MADNVVIPATGSGTATPSVATDDVGGIHYQKMKLDGGADGLTVPIIAGQQLAAGSVPVVLTAAQITTLTPVAGLTDAQLRATAVPVSLASVPSHAVTNAGTFAVQDAAAEASLSSLDTKTPALGQAVAASSVPVVLTAAQMSTLAPLTFPVEILTLGNPTGLAVITDVDGTIQQYLRGLVKLAITAGGWLVTATLAAGSAIIGKVGIDQTTPGTTNAVQANAGTNLNTSALALEAGGNLAGAAASLAVMDDWDETDRAKVNLIVGQAGIAAGTGVDGVTVPRVTLATNVALPAGTNAIGKLAANSGVDIGDVDVTSLPALAAGTALVGKVGIDQTTPGTTDSVSVATAQGAGATLGVTSGAKVITDANGTIQQYLRGLIYQLITAAASFFTPVPDTVNGWLVALMTSSDGSTALTATAQVVKASAGKLGGYYIYNPNAAATYVHLYNVAAASVTVGTTAPQCTFCIPATSAANLELVMGVPFTNAGWAAAATTTGPGNTAPATALEAMFFYK